MVSGSIKMIFPAKHHPRAVLSHVLQRELPQMHDQTCPNDFGVWPSMASDIFVDMLAAGTLRLFRLLRGQPNCLNFAVDPFPEPWLPEQGANRPRMRRDGFDSVLMALYEGNKRHPIHCDKPHDAMIFLAV